MILPERRLAHKYAIAADPPFRPAVTTVSLLAPPKFEDDPFTLGVASGDPWPDSVVLWTRLMQEEGRSRPDRFRFAVVSCQKYESGYYTAIDRLCEEDLSLVLHVGNYIYETGPSKDVREMPAATAITLRLSLVRFTPRPFRRCAS